MSEVLLRVDVQAGYGKRAILEDVRMEIGRGERLGLAGTSGGGKSTLVLALMGLLKWRPGWAKGEVFFDGMNLLTLKEREMRRIRGRVMALVPQSPLSALNGALSLRAHFQEAWRAHDGGSASRLKERLCDLFEQVHLFGERRVPMQAAGTDQRWTGAASVDRACALASAGAGDRR